MDRHIWKGGQVSRVEQREKFSCNVGPPKVLVNFMKSTQLGWPIITVLSLGEI